MNLNLLHRLFSIGESSDGGGGSTIDRRESFRHEKQYIDNLDAANKELERMRKSNEKLQAELTGEFTKPIFKKGG